MVRTMTNRVAVEGRLAQLGTQFEQLVRSLPGDAGAAPVPACAGWTVADVAAHVLTLWRRAISDFRRSDTAEATAALNAVCLDETPERDLGRLADLLAADGTAARAVLASLPVDLSFPFHAGTTTTVVPASCVVVAELAVHGYDVAQATGTPWSVDDEVAALVLDGFDGLLREGWLAPGDGVLLDRVLDEQAPTAELLLELMGRRAPSTPAVADLVARLRPF